jgi:hypothetical protein
MQQPTHAHYQYMHCMALPGLGRLIWLELPLVLQAVLPLLLLPLRLLLLLSTSDICEEAAGLSYYQPVMATALRAKLNFVSTAGCCDVTSWAACLLTDMSWHAKHKQLMCRRQTIARALERAGQARVQGWMEFEPV